MKRLLTSCVAALCASFLLVNMASAGAAVPVKSFDSGDSNRDLHMIQVVRAGAYPMVVVRTRPPEKAAGDSSIKMDLVKNEIPIIIDMAWRQSP